MSAHKTIQPIRQKNGRWRFHPTTRKLWFALADLPEEATINELAKRCKISRRTVQRHMRVLESTEINYIEYSVSGSRILTMSPDD